MRYPMAPGSWSRAGLVLGLGLLSGALLTCRGGTTRQTYHVTAEQLHQMGQIAGIAPCPQGPTIIAAVTRSKGGGMVHVECPGGTP